MDRLAAIRTFCKLAEAESFVAAARALRVSPAVVSKRIGALEDALGTRLVQRNTRHAALTPAGVRFYERCASALGDLELALEETHQAGREPRGILRAASPPAFAASRIAPHLAEFAARFPEVRLELDPIEREVDLIDEGFDVAIRVATDLPGSRLVARQLARCPLLVLGAPAYLDRRGSPDTLEALGQHEFLAPQAHASGDAVRLVLADGRTLAVPAARSFASGSEALLRVAAIAGMGLAVLPAYLVADDVASGRLRVALPDHPLMALAAYAVYPSRRHLSPNVRVFVDFLAAKCGATDAPEPAALGLALRPAPPQRSSARSGA